MGLPVPLVQSLLGFCVLIPVVIELYLLRRQIPSLDDSEGELSSSEIKITFVILRVLQLLAFFILTTELWRTLHLRKRLSRPLFLSTLLWIVASSVGMLVSDPSFDPISISTVDQGYPLSLGCLRHPKPGQLF